MAEKTLPMLHAVSALLIPAIIRCAKVEQRSMNVHTKRHASVPRECSASEWRALPSRPMGNHQLRKMTIPIIYTVCVSLSCRAKRGREANCIPRYLHRHIGNHECFPRISLRRALADFVKRSLGHEEGDCLLYKLHEDCEESENPKNLVSHALLGFFGVKEREPDKDRLAKSISSFEGWTCIDGMLTEKTPRNAFE